MSTEGPLVKVDDLVVRFPIRMRRKRMFITPVNHVSLEIAPGEVLSLVGESGSGKTTLGRTLVRLNEPSSGKILIAGDDVTHIQGTKSLFQLRRHVQMVFQDPFGSLNPVRTVGQHLSVLIHKHQKLRGHALTSRVQELLEVVGLKPGADAAVKYPHEMSGGQRQRVAIARALAVNPKFIVADEPISMLDVSIRADILKLLNQLKADFNLSFLYITHDLASAKYFGDRIMVLYGGAVMETGPSKRVVGHPLHPYTRLLLSSTVGSPVEHESIGERSVEPPDLLEGRLGCPFAHRCPSVTSVCHTETPEQRELEEGHFVACHHAVG